jgi:hypothetical protein
VGGETNEPEEAPDHGFKEGNPVWVEDGEGRRHPGVFVGETNPPRGSEAARAPM